MKIRFAVLGQPVGKNESKGFRGSRFFVPKATKVWQRRVAVAAALAASEAKWPDPFAVRLCAYRIFRYNVRGDHDRGDTYAVDALQFTRWWTPRGETPIPMPIGLFANDKFAYCEGSYPSVADAGEPRIEIEVELKALRSPAEADVLRRRWYANEARRKEKKAAQRSAKDGREVASVAAKRSRDELAQVERNLGLRLF